MAEVFEVYVKTHFSAAHALRGYPGDCARTHGHNWIIEAFIRCTKLDDIGIGIDFRDIKQGVKGVLSGLDHFNLNELAAFENVNPTSENIATVGIPNSRHARITRHAISPLFAISTFLNIVSASFLQRIKV